MTVEELIRVLGNFDRRLRVVMPSEIDDWCDVVRAEEDTVRFGPEGAQIAYPDEDGAELVLRLLGPETT